MNKIYDESGEDAGFETVTQEMEEKQKAHIALSAAVEEAFAELGVDAFKSTSLFLSNKVPFSSPEE